jgi:serine phosphatase RsbU (regulator of sigma subunit)
MPERRKLFLHDLALISDNAPDGFVVTDLDGKILLFNRAALQMHGIEQVDDVLVPFQSLGASFSLTDLNGNPVPVDDWPIARLVRGETFRDQVYRLSREDNSDFWWASFSGGIAIGDDREHSYGVLNILDITKRKNAEDALETILARERLINRTSHAIRNSADALEIQDFVVRELAAELKADRCCLLYVDETADKASIVAAWSESAFNLKGINLSISDTGINLREVFAGGRSVRINDITEPGASPELLRLMETLGSKAKLLVPLLGQHQEVVGILEVAQTHKSRVWTDDEVALIEQVASMTRSAIEAASIRRREQRIAIELQNALQPTFSEEIPNLEVTTLLRPALEDEAVGGDFYDIFRINTTKYALVIGDVSGKGLAAAAQIATVRNMLRAVLYRHQSVGAALFEVNNVLYQHKLIQGFVTSFVTIFDTQTKELQYSSCGHEPAILVNASRNTTLLELSGPPLGVIEEAEFKEHSVYLQADDRLLLHTDGITEAGASLSNQLQVEGVAKLLRETDFDNSIAQSLESILDRAQTFAEGKFHDDVCLMLIHCL